MLVRALLLVLAVAAARCDVEVKTYPGKPVAIWSYSTGELELNTEQLDGIFGHEALAGRKIVAYSIDGDKHEGKTFFMDYVLRYMYNTYKSVASPETPFNHDHADWLGSPEEPLKGFTSYERDVGVLMWSDVFLHDGPEGEKYAIIIAVTKGIPDADSNENSMFFFLSSVVASVQLFNLRGSLEQKHFDRISVAAKFGEDALKHGVKDEPFGKLTFLIRSSIDPHYGYDAGVKSFEKYWAAEDKQTAEYKDFLKNLDHSFKGFACFQFISPGPKVFEAGFDGRKSQLDQIYLEQIKFIVEDIFDVTEKEVKLIHGEQLEVSKYYAYLKKYAEIMKDDKTVKLVTAFFDVKI